MRILVFKSLLIRPLIKTKMMRIDKLRSKIKHFQGEINRLQSNLQQTQQHLLSLKPRILLWLPRLQRENRYIGLNNLTISKTMEPLNPTKIIYRPKLSTKAKSS